MRRRTGEEWRSSTSMTRTESRSMRTRASTWSGLPQDLREVPTHEAVEALRSLVRAAAGPELKFRAGVETTVGELAVATTSGVGLAKEQFKFFDPGGG